MIYQRGHLARPLDAVLGHASRLSVLRVLVASPDGVSGRQIALRAGINHQAAALALRALQDAGIALQRDSGRSILWRLDRKKFLVDEMLLALFEGEARHAQDAAAEIKNRIGRKADAVVMVGKAGKGLLALGEPLELVLICEQGRRNALLMVLRDLAHELRERFGLGLKHQIISRKDAPSRIDMLDGWQLLPTEGRPSVFISVR